MDQYLINLYEDFPELSDLKKQEEYWLGKSTKFISSFVEINCRLFDDDGFDDFLETEAEKEGFNAKAIANMKILRQLLKNYKEKLTDKEILEDAEWHKISTQAKTVLPD